jgi:hypothetical protein
MAGRKVKIFTDWRKVVQTLEDSYENLNGVPRPEWMMKDIIQNSWDARKDKNNAENWVFTISLIEAKGSNVIVFEDEGTTGLTGKLTADEATKKLENGEELPPTERRARFYANAVTWSDGQDAAGGRGQGKGVLVIANSYESVVFESKSADGYFSGALVQDYGAKPVFWLTAAFPLLVTAAAAVIPEQRVGSSPGSAGVLAEAGGVAPSRCLNETFMVSIVDAVAGASGMAAAGYDIINLSEAWPAPERAANGSLVGDPERFPHGIAWLADYVHARGLRVRAIGHLAGDEPRRARAIGLSGRRHEPLLHGRVRAQPWRSPNTQRPHRAL